MSTVPLISVLLPVYNAQDTLREAVESILKQTFSDFELLIVNDGSTDESLAIAKSLSQGDGRIRIINQQNSGIVIALNRGMSEAQGKYIARMDADDVSHLDRFEKQVSALNQNSRIALLGSFYTELPLGREHSMPVGPKKVSAYLRDSGNAFVHSSIMMRTEVARSLKGYRALFLHCEDYDLWLRIADLHQVDNLPEYLIGYRRHAGSVSHQNLEQQFLSAMGARRCAALRRNGFAEPVFAAGDLSVELLESWGLRKEELCRLMIEWLSWNHSSLSADEESSSVAGKINNTIERYRKIRADYRLGCRRLRREQDHSSACF